MKKWQIVLDTNVIVSALRSRQGAAHRLLLLIEKADFEFHVSAPLILEYESVLKRQCADVGLTLNEIDDVLDYLCAVAQCWRIFFLWRPLLKDPKDDMVLELAVTAHCDAIITYNHKDFAGVEKFGLRALSPQQFLQEIGELK